VLQAMQVAFPGDSRFYAIDKMKLVPKAVCHGGHDEGSAAMDSSTIHKLNSPICVNVNSLARYPSESLKVELIPLLFHEWTHQLGFGEREAIEFQNYVKHYLPVVFSMMDEPDGEEPMRVGGVHNFVAQDGTTVTVRCMTHEQWQAEEKGGAIFKSSLITVFPGDAIKVRGQNYGDAPVACGDLPQLDCQFKKADDDWCQGDYVLTGPEKGNWICLGKLRYYKDGPWETDFYPDRQSLRDAKVCKSVP
jgi:hypothetical protein